MEWALPELREVGFDGIMFETPATRLEAVLDIWLRFEHLGYQLHHRLPSLDD